MRADFPMFLGVSTASVFVEGTAFRASRTWSGLKTGHYRGSRDDGLRPAVDRLAHGECEDRA